MASLREILEKQRQEKANAKQTATPKSTIPDPIPVRAEERKTEENNGTVRPSEIVAGNGSDGGQENAPVPPAGLSGLALLKWKKENAKPTQEKSNAGQAKPVEAIISTAQIAAIRATGDTTPSIGHREAEKTNDGNIEVQELKNQLIYLANNIDQKELVAQIVRTIAVQLKQNPALCPFMKKSDVDLVVRGVRMSYQVAARKKSEKAETKSKKTAMDSDLGKMFKDAGLGDLAAKLGNLG